jgi:integrase
MRKSGRRNMAAFRVKQSPIYRIEPTIGGVKLPRMSTFTRDKKVAEQMENALHTLANSGYSDLIEQLRDGAVTLREIWHAHMKPAKARVDALDALRTRKDDPLLSEVVPARKAKASDARVKSGYDQLLEYAPDNARVSWLLVSTNVTELYEDALADREPNSVRRSLHRAVCDLLTSKYGRGRMLAVMADAVVPSEQDERLVEVTKKEIQLLTDPANSDPIFVNAVGFALTSGIDQGPMLRLFPTSVDESGVITVPDTKNTTRWRKFKLDDEALRYFRLASAGKADNERVFPWTRDQVRDRWEALRKRIGRTDLRWKDLRGVFATYFLQAGNSPRELQHILGHSAMNMTLRYVKRMAGGSTTSIGKAMGLDKAKLKLEKGGA